MDLRKGSEDGRCRLAIPPKTAMSPEILVTVGFFPRCSYATAVLSFLLLSALLTLQLIELIDWLALRLRDFA